MSHIFSHTIGLLESGDWDGWGDVGEGTPMVGAGEQRILVWSGVMRLVGAECCVMGSLEGILEGSRVRCWCRLSYVR